MAAIGQELLNVPMGDMIRQMAFAIADAQYRLDENSINVAEMMGGLTTVYDENGQVSFDDSRVFFGYDYMTVPEAQAYATADKALSGDTSLTEFIDKLPATVKSNTTDKIRVPTRVSMLELGFTPVFYQFVDTIIEVKIAIKITRTHESTTTRTATSNNTSAINNKRRSFFGTTKNSYSNTQVNTAQVDATYASKYSYSAEGASILRTKLTPVPPPPMLEQRIRDLAEHEAAVRAAKLAASTVVVPNKDK